MHRLAVSGLHRLASLVLVAALASACQPIAREPRRLAFPAFQAAALFPEYRSAADVASRVGTDTTQFARDLNARPGGTAPGEPAAQSVPLGSSMIAEIPDEEGWIWSLAEGVTLVAYSPAGGRPGALVYAEAFSPLIHEQPSAEHLRFQIMVDPEFAAGYLSEPARWMPLLGARTPGRGLGFRPTRGTFTGWRWVGRNAQGVTLRCGRSFGLWAAPASLRGVRATPSSAVSASLVLGSVTDRDEQTGVHLAVLCVREPRCLVYKDLARFLASIQPGEASLMERLRSTPPIAFRDLVRESGLAIETSAR